MADAAKQSRSRRKPRRAAQLGVTDEEYARMLTAQGGGCAICGAKPKTRRLHVDHDHATGEVRALTCHRCNRNLPTWVTPRWAVTAAVYLEYGPEASMELRDREPGETEVSFKPMLESVPIFP